jgi:fucose permease
LTAQIDGRSKNFKRTKMKRLMAVWACCIFAGKYLHHHLMRNGQKYFMLEVFIIIFVRILFAEVLRKMMIKNYFLLIVGI